MGINSSSCRHWLKKSEILNMLSLYIYSLMWFVVDSKQYFQTNCSIHIFMCCWPCILIIFDFMFQLNAPFVYYIFFIFLYMFRAILCSSSGGSIVYTQHLVLYMSLFLGDRSMHRQLEDSNCLCTERSLRNTDI